MLKYSFWVLCWSLAGLATTIIGMKKASAKITLAGQLMGIIGAFCAWIIIYALAR